MAVEDVPGDMPFGHSKMVRSAVTKVRQLLLLDPGLTGALLREEVTRPEVVSLLAACGDSEAAAGSRLDRSVLYKRTGAVLSTGEQGRPSVMFRRA